MQDQNKNPHFDVVVVGSGFGGSMIANRMSASGMTVALIERGGYVTRSKENWGIKGSLDLTDHHDKQAPYIIEKGGNKKEMGVYSAVGGPSLFYGGVSFRFREKDFHPPSQVTEASNAEWPISYDDLSNYYDRAEVLLNIAGEAGVDPTEPPRNFPFPQNPPAYAAVSQKIKSAAEKMDLAPFHLPLAINYNDKSRTACSLCTTCDTYACATSSKNDLETMLIKGLDIANNVSIFAQTIVTNLVEDNGKITKVRCLDTEKKPFFISANTFILSAGAMASPHIILNSGLEKMNPSGDLVGRHLMRHNNAIVFGIFPGRADKEMRFHKELAIMDYYFGHPEIAFPTEKIGSLQQVATPPRGLVENAVPFPFGKILSYGVDLITGLLAIVEDQPQYKNHIKVDTQLPNKYGMASPKVWHEYSKRDELALSALAKKAQQILKKAGAIGTYTHKIKTFSHAVGTIRMGIDKNSSPLDKFCNFRGVENLYVVDGSFMPTSAAVNPSLTIAANALRIGDFIVKNKS